MTDTRQPTCAERLPEHLAGRLADFRAMFAREDPHEPTDAEYDADELGPIGEYPLAATVRYAVRVDLSTGGPADYLEYIVDGDGTVSRASYHFADWFDHAEQLLIDDDFTSAERFLEALYGDLSDLSTFVRE
jgi:hypothetical protein